MKYRISIISCLFTLASFSQTTYNIGDVAHGGVILWVDETPLIRICNPDAHPFVSVQLNTC